MASKSAEQICKELRSGLPVIQLSALTELRVVIDSNSKEEMQQLCEHNDAALLVMLTNLLQQQNHPGASDSDEKGVMLEAWQVLVALLNNLEPESPIVSRLVHECRLVKCIFRAVMRLDGDTSIFSSGLACILALKRHNVVLASVSASLCEAIAIVLGANSNDEVHMPLQLEVLKALSAESVQCARVIQQAVCARLDAKSTEFNLLVLEYLLKSYDPTAKVPNLNWRDGESWDLSIDADLLIRLVQSGHAFERLIVLRYLRFGISDESMADFLARGGLSVLASVTTSECIHDSEHVVALMNKIAKSSASHRLQVVEYQVAHDQVEILSQDVYDKMLTLASANTDFELFKQRMRSESEELQRRSFTLLPKNIEILAPFCIEHGLIPILTQLLLDEGETQPTSEYIKYEIWTLLVHIIYELPRMGIWKLRESCELASLALKFATNALFESPLAVRKHALVYLVAPLNKSRVIRDQLVNGDSAIPTLVHLLAQEEESSFATLLGDFVRDLLTGGRDYAAELDLVVRGILENEDSEDTKLDSNKRSKRNYMNLLSLYRRAETGVLGLEANDDIANLKLCVSALDNGSELEKFIVLKQLKRFAASWSSIHVGILREKLLAIACVVAHEPSELKQLAVQVLWILAKLDRICCENVMAAQLQFWPDEPIFSFQEAGWAANSQKQEENNEEKDDDEDEDEYEYSEQESDNEIDTDDADESAIKKQKVL